MQNYSQQHEQQLLNQIKDKVNDIVTGKLNTNPIVDRLMFPLFQMKHEVIHQIYETQNQSLYLRL